MYKNVHVAWHKEFLKVGREYHDLHYDVSAAVIDQKGPYSASK